MGPGFSWAADGINTVSLPRGLPALAGRKGSPRRALVSPRRKASSCPPLRAAGPASSSSEEVKREAVRLCS